MPLRPIPAASLQFPHSGGTPSDFRDPLSRHKGCDKAESLHSLWQLESLSAQRLVHQHDRQERFPCSVFIFKGKSKLQLESPIQKESSQPQRRYFHVNIAVIYNYRMGGSHRNPLTLTQTYKQSNQWVLMGSGRTCTRTKYECHTIVSLEHDQEQILKPLGKQLVENSIRERRDYHHLSLVGPLLMSV